MELQKRKRPRLKEYDYSQSGYYYVTICTNGKLPILSSIEHEESRAGACSRRIAPALHDVPCVALSSIGKIAEEQLIELTDRYPYVKIDKYVIMPTHIHVIIVLENETAGASPRPTLTDIVCAYKSIMTRLCNKHDNVQGRKIWQASFYDEIIRNEKAYEEIWQYIETNPLKWEEDKYY